MNSDLGISILSLMRLRELLAVCEAVDDGLTIPTKDEDQDALANARAVIYMADQDGRSA